MSSANFQHPELDGSSFFWTGGEVGVLLFHGFTATTIEVKPLAQVLHSTGYTVAGPLLPGHGTSPEDLNRQRWTDWVATAEEALQVLKENCQVVFLIGESMGALLSLYLAAKHPEISGQILFAPALQVPGIRWSRLVAPFVASRPKKHVTGKDPARFPWQGYTVVPVRAATQLYFFQQIVKKHLADITQPTLIFQGRLDQSIDPQSAQVVFDSIRSVDKHLIWLDQSPHVIILDRDFEFAAHQTVKFIEEQTSKQPGERVEEHESQ